MQDETLKISQSGGESNGVVSLLQEKGLWSRQMGILRLHAQKIAIMSACAQIGRLYD